MKTLYLFLLSTLIFSFQSFAQCDNCTTNFTVTYADDGTGLGFDDPAPYNCAVGGGTTSVGAQRKFIVCEVLKYIESIIDLNGTSPHIHFSTSLASPNPEGAIAAVTEAYNPNYSTYSQIIQPMILEHITSRIDASTHCPTGVVCPDATIECDFGFPLINLELDPQNAQAGSIDFFEVVLHEVTHALGVYSLIQSDGTSNLSGNLNGPYTSFDAHMRSKTGNLVIKPDASYNTTHQLMLENTVFYDPDLDLNYDLYDPANWIPGSSLSHFVSGVNNFDFFLYSATSGGTAARTWTPFEIRVLCLLGYDIKGNAQTAPFGCTLFPVGKVDNFSHNNTLRENTFDVLYNDLKVGNNPLIISLLHPPQVSAGEGDVYVENNQLVYVSPNDYCGPVEITYSPQDKLTGRIGTATTCNFIVDCDYCPDDPCNLICNGGFESGISLFDFDQASNRLDLQNRDESFKLYGQATHVTGWWGHTGQGTPDLFIRGSQKQHPTNSPLLVQGIPESYLGQVETHNGTPNDRFMHSIYSGNSELFYTKLTRPLVAGNHNLSFWVYLVDSKTYSGGTTEEQAFNIEFFIDDEPDNFNSASLLSSVEVLAGSGSNHVSGRWIQYNAVVNVPQSLVGQDFLFVRAKEVDPADITVSGWSGGNLFFDDLRLELSGPLLAIDKTVDNPTPDEGDLVKFTFEITNTGNQTANIWIEDYVPLGLTITSNHNYSSYNSSSRTFSEGPISVQANQTISRDFEAQVDNGTSCQRLTSVATIANSAPLQGCYQTRSSQDIVVTEQLCPCQVDEFPGQYSYVCEDDPTVVLEMDGSSYGSGITYTLTDPQTTTTSNSTGTFIITSHEEGIYSIEIKDANGCVLASQKFTIIYLITDDQNVTCDDCLVEGSSSIIFQKRYENDLTSPNPPALNREMFTVGSQIHEDIIYSLSGSTASTENSTFFMVHLTDLLGNFITSYRYDFTSNECEFHAIRPKTIEVNDEGIFILLNSTESAFEDYNLENFGRSAYLRTDLMGEVLAFREFTDHSFNSITQASSGIHMNAMAPILDDNSNQTGWILVGEIQDGCDIFPLTTIIDLDGIITDYKTIPLNIPCNTCTTCNGEPRTRMAVRSIDVKPRYNVQSGNIVDYVVLFSSRDIITSSNSQQGPYGYFAVDQGLNLSSVLAFDLAGTNPTPLDLEVEANPLSPHDWLVIIGGKHHAGFIHSIDFNSTQTHELFTLNVDVDDILFDGDNIVGIGSQRAFELSLDGIVQTESNAYTFPGFNPLVAFTYEGLGGGDILNKHPDGGYVLTNPDGFGLLKTDYDLLWTCEGLATPIITNDVQWTESDPQTVVEYVQVPIGSTSGTIAKSTDQMEEHCCVQSIPIIPEAINCDVSVDFEYFNACGSQQMQITNVIFSGGSGLPTYTWDVNGTVVSNLAMPQLILAPGNNTVCLTITYPNGCSKQVCKSIFIGTEFEYITFEKCAYADPLGFWPCTYESCFNKYTLKLQGSTETLYNYDSETGYFDPVDGWVHGCIWHALINGTYDIKFFDDNGCLIKHLVVQVVSPTPTENEAEIIYNSCDCIMIDQFTFNYPCAIDRSKPITFTFDNSDYDLNTTALMLCSNDEGPFSVSYFDTDGCECILNGDIECPFPPNDQTASIHEFAKLDVVVKPNPSKGIFHISIDNSEQSQFSYSILDLHGKRIQTGNFNSSTSINLRNEASGIYHLKLKNEDLNLTLRLIVE